MSKKKWVADKNLQKKISYSDTTNPAPGKTTLMGTLTAQHTFQLNIAENPATVEAQILVSCRATEVRLVPAPNAGGKLQDILRVLAAMPKSTTLSSWDRHDQLPISRQSPRSHFSIGERGPAATLDGVGGEGLDADSHHEKVG